MVVSDLKALEAACKELGLQFMRDQKHHAWWGHWVNDFSASNAAYIQSGIKPENYGKCEHVIKLAGCQYEIGVYKNPKGPGFVLAYDNYYPGKPISEKLGVGLEKLKQMYSTCKTEIEARAKGWITARKKLNNGSIQITITGV